GLSSVASRGLFAWGLCRVRGASGSKTRRRNYNRAELAASALVGGLHHQLRNSRPSSGTSRLPVLIPLGGIAAVGRRRQGRAAGRVRLDPGSEIVRRRASRPEVVDCLLARIQNDGRRFGIGERTSAALSPDRVRQADDV